MEFKNQHVLLLCCTAFLAMAGGALLAPALPEMMGPLHATERSVALLMSVYMLSTAIFTLVIGHVIDRVDRKTILIPCLLIYGLTGLLSFFVADFSVLLVLRFIQGSGVAGMLTLALLIISDVFTGKESMKPVSRVSISLALGSVLAPVIGGGLATLGWNYPFLFYALSLPFALLVIALLPETRVQALTDRRSGISEALLSLKDLRVSYTLFLGFAVFFVLLSLVIYLPFLVRQAFGFASGPAGLLLGAEGIAVMLLASRVHSLAGRYTVNRIIVAGFILVGLAMIGISLMPPITGIILLLLLFGAGFGLAQTAIDIQVIRVSPAQSRGGILSMHTCGKYLGMSLAPVLLGIVLNCYGISAVFIVAGALGLLVAVTTYAADRHSGAGGPASE